MTRSLTTLLALALLLALICALGVSWGSSGFMNVLHAHEAWQRTVLFDVRLPRVVVGLLVGASLAASGATLQSLFKSPLADPGILGVSSGASLAAVVCIASGVASTSPRVIPLAAFGGALAAALLLLHFARMSRERNVSLLIVGAALSSFLGALTSLVLAASMASYLVSQQIVYWLLGGLEARTWEQATGAFFPTLIGILFFVFRGPELDALQLGESEAAVLGVDVPRVRRELLLMNAVLVGVSVAIAGSIGFVGLLVPHALRRIVGAQHRVLVPASALAGAVLVVLCDLIARSLFTSFELPVGVLTALLGAPFLFAVAWSKR